MSRKSRRSPSWCDAVAAEHGFPHCEVVVNAADDVDAGSVYLTVTGTSAEAGDDGEVGRGNRINGLITPGRPMSLEAAAGKNPRTHTGKIYSVTARAIAEMLVADVAEVAEAQCIMVSQIGRPLSEPAAIEVKLATRGGPLDRAAPARRGHRRPRHRANPTRWPTISSRERLMFSSVRCLKLDSPLLRSSPRKRGPSAENAVSSGRPGFPLTRE